MRVLVLQLDGKIPNLACMRLIAHHRELGDDVEFRRAGNAAAASRRFGDHFHRVYGSLIFERTRPLAKYVARQWPGAILGGTGWELSLDLADIGIGVGALDYSDWPRWTSSIGFTQRGCRLRCPFCVVPRKEGAMQPASTVTEIWRGDPWPRHLLLLDNDFFGQPDWEARIDELRAGGFRVSFNQGINARFLTPETAAAIASVDYRADDMRERRIYTAWDNRRDEHRLMRGLQYLVDAGVTPRHIMVYMLIGYWAGERLEDWEHRRRVLRDFGARPYPMPFNRTRQELAFQRWVVGAYDKSIPWDEWTRARWNPRRLTRRGRQVSLPLAEAP